MSAWLKNARFYEIYPQSFYDGNGDGIGDINGIREKLDYIKHLGFNALWLNPCFLSPFMDAGYDVEDYYKVAPRYGTNEDLYNLFDEAHSKGIRVILDLVPGHTSDRCRWFEQSALPQRNEYSDRYVWTDCVWDRPEGYSWVAGMRDRDGCYMINFFNSQPALNYGFNRVTRPEWQIPYTDDRVKKTFDEILSVMRFWLDKHCDGFRVDMADSLVKNDDGKVATASLWQRARRMLDEDYPEAVMISEWCDAPRAVNMAGFHSDFILNHGGNLSWHAFRRVENGVNKSYFCSDALGDADKMLERYLSDLAATRECGYMSLISGNHDTERIAHYLTPDELKVAYTFILTMPGAPFFYYGDEIGMRYLPQSSKEGGYHRTGSRTPMQWDKNLPNLGFSEASADKLYLPVDASDDCPAAAQQLADPASLLNAVRALNTLRDSVEELQADADFRVLYKGENGYPLCYLRGTNTVIALNASKKEARIPLSVGEKLFETGKAVSSDKYIEISPVSAAVFSLKK